MSVERAIVSRRGSSRLVYTRRLLPDPAFHSVRTLSLSFPCAVCLVLATGKGPCWRWSSLWWILDALVHSGAGATNREAGERIRERVVLNADGQSAANPPIRDDGPANSLALVYAAQELFGCVWNKENWYWRERREKNHALGYDSRAMSNDAPGCESLAWWFPSLSRRWLISSERRDAFLNTQMTCQTLYIQSALLPSRPSIFFNSICLVSPLMLTACAPTPTVCCCWRKTSSPLTAEMYIYIFRAYYYCWICVSPLSDIPRPADTPWSSLLSIFPYNSLSLSPIYDAAMTRDGIGHPAHDVPLIPISALHPGRKECPSTQWHPSDMQHRSTDWINQRHRDDLPLFIRVFKTADWWRAIGDEKMSIDGDPVDVALLVAPLTFYHGNIGAHNQSNEGDRKQGVGE